MIIIPLHFPSRLNVGRENTAGRSQKGKGQRPASLGPAVGRNETRRSRPSKSQPVGRPHRRETTSFMAATPRIEDGSDDDDDEDMMIFSCYDDVVM